MSFGFGLGDFIAVLKLVTEARKRFVDAPSQFNNVSNELRDFLIIVHDIDIFLSGCELAPEQQAHLQSIMNDSHSHLIDVQKRLDQYGEIGVPSTSKTRRVQRAWKRLKWEPEDIQEIRGGISLNATMLNAFRGQLSRIQQDINCLTGRSNQQERHKIHNWIGTVDYGLQQKHVISKHEPGTGRWLLDSDEFRKWIKTKGEVLFCPGLQGAGKTILSSIVIEHLLELFRGNNGIGIAYHYCDFRHQDNEDASVILSSILKQLAQCLGSLPDALSSLYNKHKARDTWPSFDEISCTVKSVVSLHSRVFIIIDGLDECPASDGSRRRILTQLFNLRDLYGTNIFATSRFIPDIVQGFEGSSVLEIRASDSDVREYLDRQMHRLGGSVIRNPELQEDICTRIVESVGGMFLLARLHLDSLVGKKSIKALKRALPGLPTGSSAYDEAYMAAMERIERQPAGQEELAKSVLAWITLAKRPLQAEELRAAIAIEDGESKIDEDNLTDIEDMVSVCAGLVTVDERHTVGLIHLTTQEYLERTQSTWFPNADAEIANHCLTYLLFPAFDIEFSEVDEEESGEIGKRQVYPLFDYVKKYGVLHARLAISEPDLGAQFFSSSSKMPRNCLLLAAKYGGEQEEATVHWLLERGVDINVWDAARRSPLHYAVLNGWKRCVQLLLRRGARLTADVDNMSPFHYTVKNDAEEIAQVFLDARTLIDTQVKREAWIRVYQQGRMIYVMNDGAQGSGGEASTEKGLTALHLATLTGSQQMAKFLLNHGANPNFPSDHGETPLHLALRQDLYGPAWPGIVDFWNDPEFRIENSLDYVGYESDSESEYCSIRALIDEARSAIVSLLLEQSSVDVNAQDIFGISPLHIAACGGNNSESMIRKLLKKGAKISVRTKKDETPLHLASREGNIDAVTTLLTYGASPISRDVNGVNALHYAAQAGHLEIMQNLVNQVPDTSFETFLKSKDKQGQNFWHHLLSNDLVVETAVVDYLLPWSVGISDLDNAGMSPMARYLSPSVLFGGENDSEVLRLMFENGADPYFETGEGLGLGHLAAGSRRVSVSLLETLASRGVDLRAKDKQRRTALHYGAINGTLTEDVLHFLCDKMGLSEGLLDVHGRIPLDYAVEMGQIDREPNFFCPDRWAKTEKILRKLQKVL